MMTEDEWRTSSRPGSMLDWLEANHLAPLRKKRLFVFSVCRLGWPHLRPEIQRLLEAAEDHAERPPPRDTDSDTHGRVHDALLSLYRVTLTNLESMTFHLISFAVNSFGKAPTYIAAVNDLNETAPPATLAALLREQFGNPFRKVRRVSAKLNDRIETWPQEARPADLLLVREWLAWENGLIPGLAQTIDEERAWERLPILADALEDAGCAESELLDHLRQQPPAHARGCWALDLLLGRE